MPPEEFPARSGKRVVSAPTGEAYRFTREELIGALSRLEVRPVITGRTAAIGAEPVADAIITALGGAS